MGSFPKFGVRFGGVLNPKPQALSEKEGATKPRLQAASWYPEKKTHALNQWEAYVAVFLEITGSCPEPLTLNPKP